MNDPGTPTPSAPVHAARLSQLLKSLANAESSVADIIKSRQTLMEGLEKMLESNRAALSRETTLLAQMGEKKVETEARKRDVEDAIMRGLSAAEDSSNNNDNANDNAAGEGSRQDNNYNNNEEPPRPNVEALTPPPVESLTPTGSPVRQSGNTAEQQPPQPHPFTLSDHDMDLAPDMQDSVVSHDGEARNGLY